MLEVIGAGVGYAASQDFVQLFNASPKKAQLDAMLGLEGFTCPAPGVAALEFTSKRAALESVQAKFLIKRFLDMYWRTPSYNLTRYTVYVLLALVFGLAYLNAGESMVFMSSVFLGVVSFNSILPLSSEERASFYRERASQTYNALWYFVGATLAEIPYIFSSCLLFLLIFFWMVGFGGAAKFFWYWLNTSLLVMMQTYFGQLLAFAQPSVEVAAIVGVMINSIFFLFMGFNPPAGAIATGYKWLYYGC